LQRISFLCLTLLLVACSETSSLRKSNPIQPARGYERLLVGNLQANYVGDDNCLAKCHRHDQIRKDFQHSVHGAQIVSETGLPLVNCESCHGPGSLAIEHAAKDLKCDTRELLPLGKFPAQAQSLICLKCHAAISPPNLTRWNASSHANSGVSCFNCHQLHQGPSQKVRREDMAELCYACHQKLRTDDAQPAHRPVPGLKNVCTDCHNPHGSPADTKHRL
jgi:DmsE family decaheme c-type cytochrome